MRLNDEGLLNKRLEGFIRHLQKMVCMDETDLYVQCYFSSYAQPASQLTCQAAIQTNNHPANPDSQPSNQSNVLCAVSWLSSKGTCSNFLISFLSTSGLTGTQWQPFFTFKWEENLLQPCYTCALKDTQTDPYTLKTNLFHNIYLGSTNIIQHDHTILMSWYHQAARRINTHRSKWAPCERELKRKMFKSSRIIILIF